MTDNKLPAGDDKAELPAATLPSPEASRDDVSNDSSPKGSHAQQHAAKSAPDPGRSVTSTIAKGDSAPSGNDDRPREEAQDSDDDDDEDDDDEEDEEEDEEDEDEEDEEPYLKYTPLTQHLRGVYRNGDAASAFLVAGDKMIVGTHNGNIHVIQLPTFQPIRVYHAHSASVTGISISPFPPPLPTDKPEVSAQAPPPSRQADSPAAASRKPREPQQVPKTPSNDIYIATSSMDGNVCVQSLVDPRDVQLRNFARPLQSVALSPEYKSDRTYLSGGLDGQLILTVGGGTGRSTSTTTGAAATASGWLGSMGIGSNTGKDTILHSGEGTVNTIQWSLSGKYAVWINEHGFKIIRTHLHHETNRSEDAWKRICHIDRPDTPEWEAMASVWKGRAEWIDETAFENQDVSLQPTAEGASPALERLRQQAASAQKNLERLLVGWGGTVWVVHVDPNSTGSGKKAGDRTPGEAHIVKMLRLDCVISGISLYTQRLLLVLAYCAPEEEEEDESDKGSRGAKGHKPHPSVSSVGSQPSGGIPRSQNNLRPELRLIDIESSEEASTDSLTVSRFERLSARDYHLGILPPHNAAAAASSKGVLEALGGIGSEMWNAAINPKSLFSSGASIRSRGSGDDASSIQAGSTSGSIRPSVGHASSSVHPNLVKPGAKIFIHSPFDCILATKRDLADHLSWLVEHQEYKKAWELLDDHPEILAATERLSEAAGTASKHTGATDEFYDDESIAESTFRTQSSLDMEKQKIGDLWIQELVEQGKWLEAARVCGKVLISPDRWEKWVWRFAGANRFDEIADFIPAEPMTPPLPTTIYEVVLGHYVKADKPRFRDLLDRWSTDLFDIRIITTALENQLKYRDVREDSIDDGEKGRDWRIVMESLARLHEANGRHREALKCYIKLQDADSTFRLIRDSHLADSVADDIPGFIGLRVAPERLPEMTEKDLEEATSEAITLLVEEAQHGLVRPNVVVEQLEAQELHLYLYFYLRGLWKGEGLEEPEIENTERLVMDSQTLVDGFADLAVHLFATYNRELLMEYLKTSTSYALEKAVEECQAFSYYDELVYLYSKTGQMKRALSLIIDRLQDVHKAIEFAKEQDDEDLWEDLLNYSMDKPSFIRGLLEHAGTAIDPIRLVQRIPEGLEVQGLREGLTHMMREHEIQYSISSGAARVLRSEVAAAQNKLRSRQRKGLKFEVATQDDETSTDDAQAKDEPVDGEETTAVEHAPQPGRCAKCHERFTEYEVETLIGYACGHVYHVSHLLELLNGGKKKVDVDLGSRGEEGGRYSVGGKVMRARLLRDRVRAGCPMCDSKAD